VTNLLFGDNFSKSMGDAKKVAYISRTTSRNGRSFRGLKNWRGPRKGHSNNNRQYKKQKGYNASFKGRKKD
jgi:hypothetical protein